jgi:hypothetical protein
MSRPEEISVMSCNENYDPLTTAAQINLAGRELVPLLRGLPKPMHRTCAAVASNLAATAKRRALAGPGIGVPSQIEALIVGCHHCCSAKASSAEVAAQARVLRERLEDLRGQMAWLHDQLEARRSFSPAPRNSAP